MLYLVMRFVDGLDLREILSARARSSRRARRRSRRPDRERPRRGPRARPRPPRRQAGQRPRAADGRRASTPTCATSVSPGTSPRSTSLDRASGRFVGTIAYIAPEQIQGAPIDARADVYSLGCMLFECLTGEAAVRARERGRDGLRAHQRAAAAPRATCGRASPRRSTPWSRKALAKAPDDRYASCGELARASEAALRGELRRRRRARRRIALGALAAAILAAAAATAGIVLTGGGGNARRRASRSRPRRSASSTPRPTRSSDASRLPASRGTSSSMRARRGCCSAISAASRASTSPRTRCSRRRGCRSSRAASRPAPAGPG